MIGLALRWRFRSWAGHFTADPATVRTPWAGGDEQ